MSTETFTTGAKRSFGVAGDDSASLPGIGKFPQRYDLIPHEVLRAIAEAYGEGAAKYSDNNWKKGLKESNLINHAQAHIQNYLANGFQPDGENDLSHAIWNLIALLYFNMRGRTDLLDITGGLRAEAAAEVALAGRVEFHEEPEVRNPAIGDFIPYPEAERYLPDWQFAMGQEFTTPRGRFKDWINLKGESGIVRIA